MKASEYIKAIQDLIAEHGDIEVKSHGYSQVITAKRPKIEHMVILTKRERNDRYYQSYESIEKKGDKVIAI